MAFFHNHAMNERLNTVESQLDSIEHITKRRWGPYNLAEQVGNLTRRVHRLERPEMYDGRPACPPTTDLCTIAKLQRVVNAKHETVKRLLRERDQLCGKLERSNQKLVEQQRLSVHWKRACVKLRRHLTNVQAIGTPHRCGPGCFCPNCAGC